MLNWKIIFCFNTFIILREKYLYHRFSVGFKIIKIIFKLNFNESLASKEGQDGSTLSIHVFEKGLQINEISGKIET